MKDKHQTSVAILGPTIDHQKSLIAMLSNQVSSLTILPDSHSYYNKNHSLFSRIQQIVGSLLKEQKKIYLEMICQKLDESSTDVIIGYWGTNPLSDLIAIKKLRPHIKIVLMVLCHPMSLNNLGVKRQQWMMTKAVQMLDGIMYPSTDMAAYFNKIVYKKKKLSQVIIPPCWPKSFQNNKNKPLIKDRPNIVFIGRTDLSGKTVHLADDVRSLMNEILDQEIELYHAKSAETDDKHPFRKAFVAMKQIDLIAAMVNYDASLLAYNTAVCSNDLRFRLTVPDRLITGVAAGIPIAIPSLGYEGAKSYLKNYPAIFEFDTPSKLKAMLNDRNHVNELKEAAWEAREKYTAENQGEILQSFINSLL